MLLTKYDLTVSIVLFNTDVSELEYIITLLNSSSLRIKIFLIDNSNTDRLRNTALKLDTKYIHNKKNLGYGKAHNIGIKLAENLSKYHLVMNSDVDFDTDILNKALSFMENNPDVGLLSPKIRLCNGDMQYSCRLLPTPFDLFARRFIPEVLKPIFKKRLDEYILAEKDYFKKMNVPNLPGCFMFMRRADLVAVNGFDENIFLYVEDIDLTRRLHQHTKTIYNPEIEIRHGLARGSYRFSKLVLYHIFSAIYYFNKWGWIFDKDRSTINQSINSNNMRNLKPEASILRIVR